jgi:predicted enzyme related to lactoylglutathione lyase
LISRDFTLPAHRWSNPAPAAATNASVHRSRSACPNSARIHLIVKDIAAEVQRLRAAGLTFRNDIVSGPGGQQILLEDPAGNPIEVLQPAAA